MAFLSENTTLGLTSAGADAPVTSRLGRAPLAARRSAPRYALIDALR
jgi:hypothetical protein